MKKSVTFIAAAVVAGGFVFGMGALSGGTGTALAQSSPKLIGSFRDWEAFTFTEKGRKICYMVSAPKSSQPKNVKRGDIYFMVTHRPAEKVRDEISVYAGYPYRKGVNATARIGGASFELITQGENAWTPDVATDKRMVRAMIKGKSMIVRGISQRGTTTTDRYSLLGFTAAHKAIDKACKR